MSSRRTLVVQSQLNISEDYLLDLITGALHSCIAMNSCMNPGFTASGKELTTLQSPGVTEDEGAITKVLGRLVSNGLTPTPEAEFMPKLNDSRIRKRMKEQTITQGNFAVTEQKKDYVYVRFHPDLNCVFAKLTKVKTKFSRLVVDVGELLELHHHHHHRTKPNQVSGSANDLKKQVKTILDKSPCLKGVPDVEFFQTPSHCIIIYLFSYLFAAGYWLKPTESAPGYHLIAKIGKIKELFPPGELRDPYYPTFGGLNFPSQEFLNNAEQTHTTDADIKDWETKGLIKVLTHIVNADGIETSDEKMNRPIRTDVLNMDCSSKKQNLGHQSSGQFLIADVIEKNETFTIYFNDKFGKLLEAIEKLNSPTSNTAELKRLTQFGDLLMVRNRYLYGDDPNLVKKFKNISWVEGKFRPSTVTWLTCLIIKLTCCFAAEWTYVPVDGKPAKNIQAEIITAKDNCGILKLSCSVSKLAKRMVDAGLIQEIELIEQRVIEFVSSILTPALPAAGGANSEVCKFPAEQIDEINKSQGLELIKEAPIKNGDCVCMLRDETSEYNFAKFHPDLDPLIEYFKALPCHLTRLKEFATKLPVGAKNKRELIQASKFFTNEHMVHTALEFSESVKANILLAFAHVVGWSYWVNQDQADRRGYIAAFPQEFLETEEGLVLKTRVLKEPYRTTHGGFTLRNRGSEIVKEIVKELSKTSTSDDYPSKMLEEWKYLFNVLPFLAKDIILQSQEDSGIPTISESETADVSIDGSTADSADLNAAPTIDVKRKNDTDCAPDTTNLDPIKRVCV